MKKIIAVASLIFVGVCAFSLNYKEVRAEDSCTAEQIDEFRTCVADGVEACNDYSCDAEKAVALTSEVLADVGERCCDKNKSRQVRRCIRKTEVKVNRSRRNAPSELKDYLKALKDELNDAKKNSETFCDDLGYSQLF